MILTDVDGLFDGDPDRDDTSVIPMVDSIDSETGELVHSASDKAGPNLSTGGMASKLEAAQLATHAGESVIIANGRRPNVLIDLLAGEPLGTLLPGEGGRVNERKRWIGFAAQPIGCLTLDAGAVRAVTEQGGSLLPIGITGVTGTFDKGDVVSLADADGEEVARGLTNYTADDLRRIIGQPSDRIAEILGRRPYIEAVHRDDLTLVGRSANT